MSLVVSMLVSPDVHVGSEESKDGYVYSYREYNTNMFFTQVFLTYMFVNIVA